MDNKLSSIVDQIDEISYLKDSDKVIVEHERKLVKVNNNRIGMQTQVQKIQNDGIELGYISINGNRVNIYAKDVS